MMTNVIVTGFILLMAYWWSAGRAFNAFIQLICTIVAIALAFAGWEWFVVDFFLGRLPAHAWGAGLLGPFAVLLIALRAIADKVILHEPVMPPLVNPIVGGVCGFISGTLIAGVSLIGLLLLGMNDIGGYRPWTMDGNGNLNRNQSLWIPADDITVSVLNMFSDGVFYPGADARLGFTHPNLIQEATLFNYDSPKNSRRAIQVTDVELTHFITSDVIPPQLASHVRSLEGSTVVAVGTNILSNMDNPGFDDDGIFRAARAQVALVHQVDTPDGDGQIEATHPIGYIQNNQFEGFSTPTGYAHSDSSVASEEFIWLFKIGKGRVPRYIRIKQVRLPIGDKPTAQGHQSIAALMPQGVLAAAGEDTANPGGIGASAGLPAGFAGQTIRISDALPFTVNRNSLLSTDVTEGGITKGVGSATKESGRVGRNLSVDRIWHPNNTQIVQVVIKPEMVRSVLGQAVAAAANVSQGPILVDTGGNQYQPIGQMTLGGGTFQFSIRSGGIARMTDLKMESVSPSEHKVVIFQVNSGIQLTSFNIGNAQQQALDLHVP